MRKIVNTDALTAFGAEVLTALDVPDADAQLLSDSLVTAELWGHSSHGMLRLPWYVDRLRSGVMTSVTQSETRDRLRRGGGPSTAATASVRC